MIAKHRVLTKPAENRIATLRIDDVIFFSAENRIAMLRIAEYGRTQLDIPLTGTESTLYVPLNGPLWFRRDLLTGLAYYWRTFSISIKDLFLDILT